MTRRRPLRKWARREFYKRAGVGWWTETYIYADTRMLAEKLVNCEWQSRAWSLRRPR